MKIDKPRDGLINVLNEDTGARARIESGPLRKRAVATNELLDDEVTASHYKVGGLDALGKKIVLGQEMDYIDWKGGGKTFYIYKMAGDPLSDRDDGPSERVGEEPDEGLALTKAIELVS